MKKTSYILALIALALSFAFDRQILTFLAAYRTPLLTAILTFLTNAATYLPIPLLILSAFMFYKKASKKITAVWISAGLAFLLAYLIKYLTNRDRPGFIEQLAPVSGSSFPSAHASTTFAPIPMLKSSLKWAWLTFAVLVAFSRVYLGVHYMSDVIGGIILGYAIGEAMNRADFSKIKFLRKLKIA